MNEVKDTIISILSYFFLGKKVELSAAPVSISALYINGQMSTGYFEEAAGDKDYN